MKTKKHQISFKEYFRKKSFKFDLSFFRCLLLVLAIFFVALTWAKVDNYLNNKFQLVDSTGNFTGLVKHNIINIVNKNQRKN